LTRYDSEFLGSAEKEFRALGRREPRIFAEKLVYLLRNPFQSYPWLRGRQGARHPGEWRFHLREYRVVYRVDGLKVVFARIVLRPPRILEGPRSRREGVQDWLSRPRHGFRPAGSREPGGMDRSESTLPPGAPCPGTNRVTEYPNLYPSVEARAPPIRRMGPV
jgi:mRNA-degrading endonuclease RelE of RelBE toxin-antitoxin system